MINAIHCNTFHLHNPCMCASCDYTALMWICVSREEVCIAAKGLSSSSCVWLAILMWPLGEFPISWREAQSACCAKATEGSVAQRFDKNLTTDASYNWTDSCGAHSHSFHTSVLEWMQRVTNLFKIFLPELYSLILLKQWQKSALYCFVPFLSSFEYVLYPLSLEAIEWKVTLL